MKHLSSDAFVHQVKLYRVTTEADLLRGTSRNAYEEIGTFSAAIEQMHFTKPEHQVAEIYQLKKIYLRVSNFYRQFLVRNNYIGDDQGYMRIASSTYDRISGIVCCMCYDAG